jgi:dTDP-4-dehydrorhamnose reductase
VVNAAAYTAVDRAESEPEAAFAVNAAGPANLAAAAARTKARFLHVSTDFVFSGEKEDPYEETDPTGALGVYGKSKEEGEARVRALLPDRHLIVRVSWLFGPDGGNFVATMLRLALERERLRVVADQRGTPTFTRDAADLLATLIAAGATGTIHGANRGVTTWCDLAREALRLRGVGTPVDAITTADYPTPAARPRNSALRNRVLENTIGDSMRPWPDALAAYLREV